MLWNAVMSVIREFHLSVVVGIIITEELCVGNAIELDEVSLYMCTYTRVGYSAQFHNRHSLVPRLCILCEHHILLTFRVTVVLLYPIAVATLVARNLKTSLTQKRILQHPVLATIKHSLWSINNRNIGFPQFFQCFFGTSHRDIGINIVLKTETVLINYADVKPAAF